MAIVHSLLRLPLVSTGVKRSLRINDQWRVCFVWTNGHAGYVEIVDYR